MRHATIIAGGMVYNDWERPRLLPGDSFTFGLGALLRRVATRIGTSEGVLVLDIEAAAELGLSVDGQDQGDAMAALRAAGWAGNVDTLRSWTRLETAGLPVMHLCVLPWVTPGTFGLGAPNGTRTLGVHATRDAYDWRATADALGLWYELTGSAYIMSPGVAALKVLRDMTPRRGSVGVTWKAPDADPVARNAAFEEPWQPAAWLSDYGKGDRRYAYDARRAGLAAAGVAPLAARTLRWQAPGQVDCSQAGWWEVTVPDWNLEHVMPHPAGPGRVPGKLAWVTTPTVALLEQLTRDGMMRFDGRHHGAWVSPASRVLRKWEERMDQAYMVTCEVSAEPGPTVAGCVKQAAAREAIGMFGSGTGSVQRSDWQHSIIAMKRSNAWRRAWSVGQQYDVWPLWIDDDSIVYQDQVTALDARIGEHLGQVKRTEVAS